MNSEYLIKDRIIVSYIFRCQKNPNISACYAKDPEFQSWLTRGTTEESAKCKLCVKEFDLRAMGRRHAMDKGHANRMNSLKEQHKINFSLNEMEKASTKDSTVKGEIRLAIFFVEHNIPMHVLDHSKVMEKIYCDSEIAKKWR